MPLLPAPPRRGSAVGVASLAVALALAIAVISPASVAVAVTLPNGPPAGWTDSDYGVTSFVEATSTGCSYGVDEFAGSYYNQGWTIVPPGVHHVLVTAVGEAGSAGANGGAAGGLGGGISAIVPATPGEYLYASPTSSVTEDAEGETAGDDYANGGHASFISSVAPTTFFPTTVAGESIDPDTLCFSEFNPPAYPDVMPPSDIVLVAGGGGGGGPNGGSGAGGNAGPNGSGGGGNYSDGEGAGGGGGGTQTGPGGGGSGGRNDGYPGGYLAGGDQFGQGTNTTNSGGGGGGGYYGGGSGGIDTGSARGGGGGGSNYVEPLPDDGISRVISNGTSTAQSQVDIVPIYEPTVTISAPVNPSVADSPTTITVTVSGLPIEDQYRAGGAGTVSIMVDGVKEQRSFDPLVGTDTGVRTATFTVNEATTGNISYTATYNGDTSQQSDLNFANIVEPETSDPLAIYYKPAVQSTVTGTMTYGDSTATFSDSESLPSGVTISGRATCTTADGGVALSTLSAGSHVVDPASCSGLTLGGPNAATYGLVYSGSVSVAKEAVTADISGNQPSGGSPTFSDLVYPPSAASAVTGTPACTTLSDGTPIGPSLPQGAYTLGSCTGLALTGPDSADYTLTVTPMQFVAGINSPTLTVPALASAVAGSPLDTRVTLSGGGAPSGEAEFAAFPSDDCSGTPFYVGSASVSGNGDYDTGTMTPPDAGTDSIRANYTGDTFNLPTETDCEQLTVALAAAGATFNIPATGAVGQPLSASATFSSDVARTSGTVHFFLFPPSDTTCMVTELLDEAVPVDSDGVFTSSTYTPTTAGTYRWVIIYGGDSNHDTQYTICQPTVVGIPPSVTSGTGTTFAAGTHGSFTVTTTAGTPAATTLSASGTLPHGVTFVDNGDGTATLAGTPGATTGGSYPLTITAANSTSSTTQSFVLTVTQSPAITSASATTFVAGEASGFTIATTAGFPTSTTLSKSGALPHGITFTDNHNGTATLSGTPGATTGGSYPLTVTATNGTAPSVTQSFVLTVAQSPAITSTGATTFEAGHVSAFTVRTTPGFPAGVALSESGALPHGVTFVDNGDGTATLAGTPGATAGGSYPLTITAGNGTAPNATQSFVLTVAQSPAITSSDATTFETGDAAAFTIRTTAGFPASTALTESGALPHGVTFVDNGDGTATLAGTPGAMTGGSYPLTITAGNGTAPNATQSFVLTVGQSAVITSAGATTFEAGDAAAFTVRTTAGFPTSTALTESGALPHGITFVDNGDGTATLAGAPGATSGGSYPLTIAAGNGTAPVATQGFMLTVAQSPAIVSTAQATFQVGQAGTYSAATTPGYPVASTLTLGGTLPSGLAFADAGDGTGTITGTPDAGTGGLYPVSITADNGTGTPAVQDLEVTVDESPAFTSADSWTSTLGVTSTFAVTTSTGYPAADTLTASGPMPPGLTMVVAGGSATISGVPTGTSGAYPITLTASNGSSPDTVQTLTLTVVDAVAVPLPIAPPISGGTIAGVPATTHPGESFTASTSGFAAGAPITWGIYSSPLLLTNTAADSLGDASASLTIPSSFTGVHTIVATGIAPDGSALIVTAVTTVIKPAAVGQLPTTGVSVGASPAAAILLVMLGLALLLLVRMRRVRRRT